MSASDNLKHTDNQRWNAVRSVTCGHLRAAHNYQSDPRKEWTDADIELINSAPTLAAERDRYKAEAMAARELLAGDGDTLGVNGKWHSRDGYEEARAANEKLEAP